MSRSVAERRAAILEIVHTSGPQRVRELARQLDVSAVTLRRDIEELAEHGRLLRRHGIACPLEPSAAAPRSQATVGLVVPHSDYYYDGIISGAKRACVEAGARLVLGVSAYNQATELQQAKRLIANGVDGLVIAPTPNQETGRLTEHQEQWLAALTVPTVLMERPASPTGPASMLDSVTSSHRVGAAVAVQHLAALGHKNIAALMIKAPNSTLIQTGYEETVAALKLTSVGVIAEGRQGSYDAAQALQALIAAGATALFIHNDQLATRALTWLQDAGTRVPQDVSIVGYDDVIAEFASVPLTSVSPFRSSVGLRSVQLLLQRIYGTGPAGRAVEHIALVPQLTPRKSSGILL